MRPIRHGDRQDCGHRYVNASNDEHQKVVHPRAVRPVLDRLHYNDLDEHSHTNRTNAEVPNGRQNLHW